jgi:phosphoribosylformylglycinamidine cyclo-ligase
METYVEELQCSVGDALLQPHRSYLKALTALADSGVLKAAAHITGGGLPGNLPRVLPKGVEARIHPDSWPELPIFTLLQRIGGVPDEDMWSTFNRGVGMTLVISPRDLTKAEGILRRLKERFYKIGEIAKGRRGVMFVS